MTEIPYVNPFLRYVGARLVRWEADFAEFHLTLRAEHLNRIGQVQGGVVCSLLDVAAGYAGLHVTPTEPAKNAVTLSLTTSFLNSGKGGLLVARGRVQRRGRSIFFAESELLLDDSVVLAKAIGTFKYIRLEG